MRHLLLIILVFVSLSCSQNKSDKKDSNDSLKNTISGKALIESGFLEYADSLKEDSLKLEIIKSFYIYDEQNYKIVHIDAEELAEYSFDFFLPNLNKILSKRNVKLVVEKTNDYESSNDIIINGEKINLYTNNELISGAFLDSGPRNFFKTVNSILKKENINEKFYLLYTGNDLSVLLLTKNQFEIISNRYINDKNEIPYLP